MFSRQNVSLAWSSGDWSSGGTHKLVISSFTLTSHLISLGYSCLIETLLFDPCWQVVTSLLLKQRLGSWNLNSVPRSVVGLVHYCV